MLWCLWFSVTVLFVLDRSVVCFANSFHATCRNWHTGTVLIWWVRSMWCAWWFEDEGDGFDFDTCHVLKTPWLVSALCWLLTWNRPDRKWHEQTDAQIEGFMSVKGNFRGVIYQRQSGERHSIPAYGRSSQVLVRSDLLALERAGFPCWPKLLRITNSWCNMHMRFLVLPE